jgi:hypothetical protein
VTVELGAFATLSTFPASRSAVGREEAVASHTV